jgi:hypothetical protein
MLIEFQFLQYCLTLRFDHLNFDSGLFTGCSIALIVALIILIHARDILNSEGRITYMENMFPLYR